MNEEENKKYSRMNHKICMSNEFSHSFPIYFIILDGSAWISS